MGPGGTARTGYLFIGKITTAIESTCKHRLTLGPAEVDNPLGREWRSGKRVGSKVVRGALGATGWLREAFRDFRLAQRWGIGVRKDVIPTGDRLKDFPAMDRHFFGGLHTEANLVPTDLHHNDGDVVVDDDALVLLPRQDKHESSSTLW
jgi:hypothetical protein